ncbi:MAG: fibronectin type III domain-containing protein [Chloroflexota bacterium]|nr:fibronectin type III domain-containing protein [Chloroflexota bacterium]
MRCCFLASLSLFALPALAQSAPPPPTNVSTSNITNDSITLTWTKSSGATSYETRYNRNPGLFDDWIDVGDVARYTFTGLLPNTNYRARVRAKNAYGESGWVISLFNGSENSRTSPAPTRSSRDSRDNDDDDDDDDESPASTAIPSATPIRDTLNYLPAGIQVSNWVDGAQGQRVGAAGVGRADVIEQGLLDAVDVWGFVTPGVEVCFNQPGRVVFLDAAYAPRQLFDLPAYQRDGMTCTTIDSAGTVVLLRGAGKARRRNPARRKAQAARRRPPPNPASPTASC